MYVFQQQQLVGSWCCLYRGVNRRLQFFFCLCHALVRNSSTFTAQTIVIRLDHTSVIATEHCPGVVFITPILKMPPPMVSLNFCQSQIIHPSLIHATIKFKRVYSV